MADADDLLIHALDLKGDAGERGARTAERALLGSGRDADVMRVHAEANRWIAAHALELRTLRDDAIGDLRQGGPVRTLGVLILFPLALPLGVHIVRNVAGNGLEWLGLVASILCVVIAAFEAAARRWRSLDKNAIGIFAAATASVVAGSVWTWSTSGTTGIAVAGLAAAALMLGLWLTMLAARLTQPAVGRLRDVEAMDRSDALRALLRARLSELLGPSPDTAAFVDEVVARAVPRPEQRLFAERRPVGQRGQRS